MEHSHLSGKKGTVILERINLELREKAAAIALAVGMVVLGVQELENVIERQVDEWFEEGR